MQITIQAEPGSDQDHAEVVDLSELKQVREKEKQVAAQMVATQRAAMKRHMKREAPKLLAARNSIKNQKAEHKANLLKRQKANLCPSKDSSLEESGKQEDVGIGLESLMTKDMGTVMPLEDTKVPIE